MSRLTCPEINKRIIEQIIDNSFDFILLDYIRKWHIMSHSEILIL